ncbi:MAG: hypothetical protein AUI33_08055 [Ignavibacteria bacterium 13_1_40CM_2_61_4]|nr:MAG: hypothetical protein AUI33_08055 [Ignavibacteria bacterium 13_1_40CM_2_61_4]
MTEASPRFKARIAGVFYLLTILTGVFGLVAGGGLVVSGDAAATATNILAHESLFRLAFVAGLIATACYIAVTALLYILFKPVSRSLSLLAAFFSVVGCAIGALSCVFHLAPLIVLGGAQYLGVFKLEQLQALALMFLKLRAQTENIGILFFGFYCLLIGYLIFRSSFLPRILGVLMAFGGLGWLTGSLANLLSPPLANQMFPYIMLPGLLGEGSLTIWLLVAGVNAQRWQEQAGRE